MSPPTLVDRTAAFCLRLAILGSAPPAALAGLMVATAETLSGWLFAAAIVLLWLSLVLLLAACTRDRVRAWRRACGCAFVTAIAALAACGLRAPVPGPLREVGPSSIFAGEPASAGSPGGSGAAGYRRWSPASLVPEVDQFKLGSYLIAAVDPLIDRAQAHRIRGLFLDVYREMGASPDFAGLCSAMDQAYLDMMGSPEQPEHTFVYLPTRSPGERLPVLLFLHGSLGNFQGYLWVLRDLADKARLAIVAPSFGAGMWRRPAGMRRVTAALGFLRTLPGVDPGRVYLAGLSNGGLGVTRAAMSMPAAFRGLVYVSPVLEPDLVSRPPFVTAWRGRPVLVVHGGQDNRIPRDVIAGAVAGMRAGTVDVTFHGLPEEDHFLMFSSRREFVRLAAAWLAAR